MEINIDFLNTSKDVKENLLPEIDDTHFMSLNNISTPRLDLYMYALSLGIKNPTPLDKKDTLIRNEYLEKHVESIALLIALAIGKKEEYESLEDALDEKKIGRYADQCANTGFKIIESDMQTKTGENSYLKMIEELDKLYERNIESK